MSASGTHRHNNFDALRIMAALMVVHGHGWMLTGGPNPSLWGIPFARVGLDVFFSISGYLVTGSWERLPRLGPFLVKRALRIFPGLVACVLVSMLVIGPAVTALPLHRYFASAGTWRYLANIALFLELFLPGVFTSHGGDQAVNGSIWSLLPEFLCYLTVPLLALLQGRLRLAALVGSGLTAGILCLFFFYFTTRQAPFLYHLDTKYALAEVPFFMAGGVIALLERRVPGLWRADVGLVFFSANYIVSSWFSWGNLPVEWMTLPYVVLCFGRMSMPVLRRAGRFGDMSYGLYLYAFPIQQLVLHAMPGDRYPVLTCAALSVIAGLLSWHLVEKPSLTLKRSVRRPDDTVPDQKAGRPRLAGLPSS